MDSLTFLMIEFMSPDNKSLTGDSKRLPLTYALGLGSHLKKNYCKKFYSHEEKPNNCKLINWKMVNSLD